ncbi:hypothetical protein BT96DRAFT_1005761 [Gymnopus androsaceus JB14]|uniref:Uncharacterized protein n=1 Tax=Gymnopus androsaceus JB14 TaxID=1447944 RepID=A0A6A4GM04_9AGAR|nr:hypothetical protein BT96DRAFT_1005761 [Gymnopus androsaceus JB14]
MEAFAASEKVTLGISSPSSTPNSAFLLPETKHPTDDVFLPRQTSPVSSPDAVSIPAAFSSDAADSDSNPHPRSHRKGIGGKLALFENIHGGPGRIPFPLVPAVTLVLSGPHHKRLSLFRKLFPVFNETATVPATQFPSLNTGHDRPYRFSFYSNALSSTIHARSLSELPADGQNI